MVDTKEYTTAVIQPRGNFDAAQMPQGMPENQPVSTAPTVPPAPPAAVAAAPLTSTVTPQSPAMTEVAPQMASAPEAGGSDDAETPSNFQAATSAIPHESVGFAQPATTAVTPQSPTPPTTQGRSR